MNAAELAGIIRDQVAKEVRLRLDDLRLGFETSVKAIPPGHDGKDGAPGEKGNDGTKGERGEKGEKGDPGEKGDHGQQGDRGEPGESGAQGEPGEKGAPGENGKNGEPGKDGLKGDPGNDGRNGADGAPGKQGDPGIAGKDGADGLRGADGEPGRDAAQIDILDAIDSEKRYPRGTYAHARGGLVRSFRTTDPLAEGEFEKAGWHVIVRGVDLCELNPADDFRTMTMRLSFTDGMKHEKTVQVPAMLYRGIWKAGDYQRGDVVTRDGCSWHANVETSGIPGTSEDWQMCVKKGRDGRDGLAGAKGERGAEGRAGRDLTQLGFDGVRT